MRQTKKEIQDRNLRLQEENTLWIQAFADSQNGLIQWISKVMDEGGTYEFGFSRPDSATGGIFYQSFKSFGTDRKSVTPSWLEDVERGHRGFGSDVDMARNYTIETAQRIRAELLSSVA